MIARRAKPEDTEKVIALCERFRHEENNALPVSFTQNDLSNWSETICSQIEEGQMFVLESEEDIIGFMGYVDSSECSWVSEETAYISDIYVVSEFRDKGGALVLFNMFMHSVKNENFKEVWTNTGINNERIQILLDRLGFESMDDLDIPDLEEQLYFKKLLN